ncbi:alpha/beta hydrolase [Sphingobium algorifonticola]|uniref:Alpha/beta hydrolase n=1 Tax=Sphingobium algorifonticola TaxID=2008318 RepID=A0A437J978_9SPHN|nr:alpha/beta hydrolase-fold protein [Sphingobium algorifonticola]RVT42059.1 alpha/beta hydrolase [Sphingobium algorifonticola]
MRWIILMLATLGLLTGKALAQPPAQGRLVTLADFPSAHVAPRTVTIWLPPGYDAGRRRYPVVYMHDGQNLFDAKAANFGVEWGMDEAVSRLAARSAARPAIIVGMASTPARYQEYMPRKIYDRLPPAYAQAVRDTQKGEPVSDAYLRFIVAEVKPYVDRHFRTLAGPADTAIMGSSMGGLISIYALGEYPQVFGSAAALSVHWPLVAADAAAKVGADAPGQVAAAFAAWLKNTQIDPKRNRLYMDHGTATLDQHYPPFAAAMEAMLPTLGWQAGPRWESRVFTGTAHNEQAWSERVDIPLVFLLGPAKQR